MRPDKPKPGLEFGAQGYFQMRASQENAGWGGTPTQRSPGWGSPPPPPLPPLVGALARALGGGVHEVVKYLFSQAYHSLLPTQFNHFLIYSV